MKHLAIAAMSLYLAGCGCLIESLHLPKSYNTKYTIHGARITCDPEVLCDIVELDQVTEVIDEWLENGSGNICGDTHEVDRAGLIVGHEIRFTRGPIRCRATTGWCAGLYYRGRKLAVIAYTEPVAIGALLHELEHASGDASTGHIPVDIPKPQQ